MSESVRVTHGVWQPREAVSTFQDRCAVLLAALPDGAALSGRTAAELHGLWIPTRHEDYFEVALSRKGSQSSELAHGRRVEIRTRRRQLAPSEVTVVHGLPVVSAERTWVDLAAELSLSDLIACGDSVLRGDPSGFPLAELVRRAHRQRGVRNARLALSMLDPRSRSRPESLVRAAFVLGGLPTPEVNVAVHDGLGQWLFEPDLHYRRPRLAFEYQGEDHAEVSRMRRDITRVVDVLGHDWQVVPLGPAEVFGRPWALAPLARTLIDRRAPGWLREWRETQRVARKSAPLVGYRATQQKTLGS